MAIPATIAGIAEPILSITDTAIVGNIPVDGVEALAAVGIVGSFLSMLIWILGQTRSAISAIISQYLGAGKLEEVHTLPAQAIFFPKPKFRFPPTLPIFKLLGSGEC